LREIEKSKRLHFEKMWEEPNFCNPTPNKKVENTPVALFYETETKKM
jgi:hypothetical protein